jgi:hypothetical protein
VAYSAAVVILQAIEPTVPAPQPFGDSTSSSPSLPCL